MFSAEIFCFIVGVVLNKYGYNECIISMGHHMTAVRLIYQFGILRGPKASFCSSNLVMRLSVWSIYLIFMKMSSSIEIVVLWKLSRQSALTKLWNVKNFIRIIHLQNVERISFKYFHWKFLCMNWKYDKCIGQYILDRSHMRGYNSSILLQFLHGEFLNFTYIPTMDFWGRRNIFFWFGSV